MEDLSEKIGALLADPGSLAQIQNLAKLLGQGGAPGENQPSPDPGVPGDAQGLAAILRSVQTRDDTTRFLAALRPLLSKERQRKLDEALRILRLLRLLPLLRDTEAFSFGKGGG